MIDLGRFGDVSPAPIEDEREFAASNAAQLANRHANGNQPEDPARPEETVPFRIRRG